MDTVKVSPKYQIVIPKRIREMLELTPGEYLEVIAFEDRIELLPVRPMKSVRGFLKEYDPSFSRDERDRT